MNKFIINFIYSVCIILPFLKTEHLNVCFDGRSHTVLLLDNSLKYKNFSPPEIFNIPALIPPIITPIKPPKIISNPLQHKNVSWVI